MSSPLRAERALFRPALAFLACAVVIVFLPARPLDVAQPAVPPALPAVIADQRGIAGELSVLEKNYFTQYGGSAARAQYGPHGLLLVNTSAPLRHLHAPDECLAGNGHRVRYLGVRYGRLPTALYRSVDAQGRVWRVAVTFVSDRGELATSVAETVWRWLQRPASRWTMVQRVSRWELPIAELNAWDEALAKALELPLFFQPA